MRCGNERDPTIWQFVIVKKQMEVSFSSVCPVIGNEFHHNIVKVVWKSTRLLPHGSTATLTMLWRNSWSISGDTWKTDVHFLMQSKLSTLKTFIFSLLQPWCGSHEIDISVFFISQSSEVTHLISCQPTALKAVRLQSLVPPSPDKICIRDLLVKNEVRIPLFLCRDNNDHKGTRMVKINTDCKRRNWKI